MVVIEVSLAVVLLVGAGLLIQSLMKLRGQYAALKPESVLTIRTVCHAASTLNSRSVLGSTSRF
jgi:hypothetical protein